MNFREAPIEKATCLVAEREGVLSLKLNLMGQRGWPDRLFLIPGGRPLFIEFKRLGESAEQLQAFRHRILKHHGYQVEVHDSVEGAVNAIRQAVERARGGR